MQRKTKIYHIPKPVIFAFICNFHVLDAQQYGSSDLCANIIFDKFFKGNKKNTRKKILSPSVIWPIFLLRLFRLFLIFVAGFSWGPNKWGLLS